MSSTLNNLTNDSTLATTDFLRPNLSEDLYADQLKDAKPGFEIAPMVMVNMADVDVDFAVADAPEGWVWRRLIDTAEWAEPACNHWPEGEGRVVQGAARREQVGLRRTHQTSNATTARPTRGGRPGRRCPH